MEQSPEGDGVVLCYVVHFLHPTADLSQQIWGGGADGGADGSHNF